MVQSSKSWDLMIKFMEITVFTFFFKSRQQASCAPMLKKTHVFFKKVPKTKIFINSGLLSLLVSKIHFLKNNVYRRWRGSDEWFGTRFFHTFHVVFRCVFDFWVFYVFYHVRAKLLWKYFSKQENLVKTVLCLVAPCKIVLNL